MGEIAEMYLKGILCERCGEYLGDAVGYPQYCSDCKEAVEKEERLNKFSKKELK